MKNPLNNNLMYSKPATMLLLVSAVTAFGQESPVKTLKSPDRPFVCRYEAEDFKPTSLRIEKTAFFLVDTSHFLTDREPIRFEVDTKKLAIEKQIDFKNYFDPVCYPHKAQDQMAIIVADYLFNKYVVKKLFLKKEK